MLFRTAGKTCYNMGSASKCFCHAVISDNMGCCVVHASICISARTHACMRRAYYPKASYLMCLPTFWLSVKPLHCSTASGISAGTPLPPSFPSPFLPSLTLHPHNRAIKFGADPSCVESSLLTHAHLPVFICHAPETLGS